MAKQQNTLFHTDKQRRLFLKKSIAIATGLALTACGGSSSASKTILPEPTQDTPGKLTTSQQALTVVIIGAGISGLVAGYELKRAGHTVIILEARARVGGRVHTLFSPFTNGQFAEAGASRIPSNHDLTLAYTQHFALALDAFYPDTGNYININGSSLSLISANEYINQPPWPNSVNRSSYSKIRGGMSKLPLAFAEQLNENITYNSAITAVVQLNDKAIIYTENGEEINADRVLCTVPLTVLNKINFSPALSDEKIAASSGGFDYTASSRLFTQFSERFWQNASLNGWGSTLWPEEIWQPTWDVNESSGIILSYLRGNNALALDYMSEQQRIDSVHARWRVALPNLDNYILNNHFHSWSQEPWTGSAYASPTSAQNNLYAQHIGQAEGRVHFAGEHASADHGWIQGALASGIRAALEIHTNT